MRLEPTASPSRFWSAPSPAAPATPPSANEVGVLTKKLALFGTKGVQDEVYAPGATYFFPPFITDWHTFETKLQNLKMTQGPGRPR